MRTPSHRRSPTFLLTLAVLALACLAACGSDGKVCDECETDNDCGEDLYCSEFEDGNRRCADSIWTTCTTKSHVTAP